MYNDGALEVNYFAFEIGDEMKNNYDVKIVEAKITGMPEDATDFSKPVVSAVLENGEVQNLFSYYSDELSFTEEEFEGLTVFEAMQLHTKRDIAYVQGA